MPDRTSPIFVVPLVAALLLGPTGAVHAAKTAEEIEACVKANLPPDTSVQTVTLRTRSRLDEITNAEVKIYFQRLEGDHANVMLRFEQPLDRRGSALLLLQKEESTEMFMYLPELDRTRRVTGRMLEGSMFGTDFTYEQFQRLQGLAEDVEVTRLPDAELGGKTVYVLQHVPNEVEGTKRERVVSYIDVDRCVQLRTEFFESEGAPSKILEVDLDKIEQDSGLWIPRKMTMRDVDDGTETDLEIEKIEIGTKIPKKVFNQASLSRAR